MAPIISLFTCLLTVVCLVSAILDNKPALRHLKAWAPSDDNCRRLVPLQLTSLVTPCVYPCLLLSPHNGQGEIVLRQEVDGTPCKIPGSESFALQISKCMRGLCQLLHDGLHLKRTKRETRLLRKRRGLVDKVKKRMKKGKEKRRKKKQKKQQKKQEEKNKKHE